MASRLLRADLCRTCRPVRPRSNTSSGGSTSLFFSTSTSGRPGSAPPSRTQQPSSSSSGATTFSSYAHSNARSLLSSASIGGVGALRAPLGAPSAAPGLVACCRWRGEGGVVLSAKRQEAGRRYLSTRRGKAVRQTLMNGQIKAQQILLVLETAGGSKETTVVSRQQALAAAEAANLDLVQVSGDKDPVVCRLMDYKREEYRKYKQKKASTKRVQKKKEVRLRGMIADHDFERKISDVKKYLERGDMVKVVLEANTSLLKRSGNCLNDLQERFEAEMEEFEGGVMKPAGGGDGYTRREIDCIPRAVKATATAPKTPKSSEGPRGGAGDAAGAGDVGQTPQKRFNTLPPASKGVDEQVIRKILDGVGDSSGSGDASDGRLGEVSDQSSSEESSSEESSSSEEEAGDVEAGVEGEQTPLQVAGTVVWDVELSGELAEAGEDQVDLEWERNEARKREDRRKREESKARVREADKFAKRSGPRSARKRWKVGDDDNDDNNGGFVAAAEWSEESGGSRRSSGRASGGRGRGRSDGGGRGAGAGASGRGQSPGGFLRRGAEESPGGASRNGPPQDGFGRPDGGRGGGRERGRGMPRPAAPPRTTPYKWRTSIADGTGPKAAAAAAAGTVTTEAPAARAARSRDSNFGDSGAVDAGGDIRGFRARFGGKTTAGSAETPAPSSSGLVGRRPAESPAAGLGEAPSERSLFPPKGVNSPPATGSRTPERDGDGRDTSE